MCVTAIVTIAITLIFRTSFTTNFAQGVISAFGAYVASLTITKLGLPVILGLVISMIASMTIAVLVDVGLFRNGRYVNALSKQIITMGLISIVTGLIPVIFGNIEQYMINSIVKGNLAIEVDGGVSITVTYNALVCVAITAIIIPFIFILLRYSKWGLSVRATASNEYVAGMMGINTHVVTAVPSAQTFYNARLLSPHCRPCFLGGRLLSQRLSVPLRSHLPHLRSFLFHRGLYILSPRREILIYRISQVLCVRLRNPPTEASLPYFLFPVYLKAL